MKLKLASILLATAALFNAAPPAWCAPVSASATLDVCQNPVTGNYRYAGVVSVDAGAALRGSADASYAVQNSTTRAGFVDVLALAPTAGVDTKGARVLVYHTEAAPLTLGSLRALARVSVYDPAKPANVYRAAPAITAPAPVAGCPKPKGCVRTQGYWSNKPGVQWPAPYERGMLFYSTGLTWQQILDLPPRGGNAYLILAHQLIAARLNIAAGASAPPSVLLVIEQALAWFASGVTLDTCRNNGCAEQKTWAGILDTYNNGLYPGAPKACPD